MFLGKFVHSKTGRMFMSLLLGLGLASLFRKVCSDRNCIIFRAPPLDKFKDKIYKDGNKCYKFNPKSESCTKAKNVIKVRK